MPHKPSILVTGCPRSGTTWVGRVLASAPGCSYVLEPLNLRRAKYFELPVSHWYPRLSSTSDPQYESVFAQLISGRRIAHGDAGTLSLKSPLSSAKHVAVRMRDRINALMSEQVILKDPIAILSADWFAERFDSQIVITVRHPAAVVSSFRLQGWSPDIDDLFHQPEVVERFFPEVDSWLRANPMRPGQDETLYNGAVLWRLMHEAILTYREQFPEWVIVRHEDLSRDPAMGFHGLMRRLGVPFTPSTMAFLARTTKTRKDSKDGNRDFVHTAAPTDVVVRDSRKHVDVWRERLTVNEIDQIRDLTGDISDHFYSNRDWETGVVEPISADAELMAVGAGD